MKCPHCSGDQTVEGTLEGVSFLSQTRSKLFLRKRVYHLEGSLCIDCGYLTNLHFSKEEVKKHITQRG
jgi:hypothetical protein